MGGVSPKTRWASLKIRNNKILIHCCILLALFLCKNCTMMHGSTNIKTVYTLYTNFLYNTSVRNLIRMDRIQNTTVDQHEPIKLLKQILMNIPNTRLNHNLFSFRDKTCDKHSVYIRILKRQEHNTASTKHVWCFKVLYFYNHDTNERKKTKKWKWQHTHTLSW